MDVNDTSVLLLLLLVSCFRLEHLSIYLALAPTRFLFPPLYECTVFRAAFVYRLLHGVAAEEANGR